MGRAGLLFNLSLLIAIGLAKGACPELFEYIQGSCFYFSSDHSQSENWQDSRKLCQDMGTSLGQTVDLAELGKPGFTAADGALMREITNKGHSVWLGASDLAETHVFHWNSGHRLDDHDSYWDNKIDQFGFTEPTHNDAYHENCVVTHAYELDRFNRHHLHDDTCSEKFNFVC